MSFIDPSHEHPPNPFLLDQSKLGQSKLLKAAAIASNASVTPTTSLPGGEPNNGHFEISTHEILSLIDRFHLQSFTYQQLKGLPQSQLNEQEKNFVGYLLNNPGVFTQIANLDHHPESISSQDIKMAAQLAGDSLVLSDADLQYLRQQPVQTSVPNAANGSPALPQYGGTSSMSSAAMYSVSLNSDPLTVSGIYAPVSPLAPLQTQDLINLLQKIGPDHLLTFSQLMSYEIDQPGLVNLYQPPETEQVLNANISTVDNAEPGQAYITPRDIQSLDFLQSDTVSRVLLPVVQPYGGFVTPEAIRVLTSLIWNPSIYGMVPIVFYKSTKVKPLGLAPVVAIEPVDDNKQDHIMNEEGDFQPSLLLEAHHILNICHKLSADGHVTLRQLREYAPENPEEEKALNLLRQTEVFEALANLDHESDLSDDDIRLALREGTIFLSDPHIILVIVP